MSKRTIFTTISPLPSSISRKVAIDFLHNHLEMIDLNPLVTERHMIPPPAHALPEEQTCVWYSITDKISYVPGGLVTGALEYCCAFHDLPTGIQTHCHAPMGVEIREKWTIGGTEPGEPPQPVELGLNAPSTGLYIREDVELRCNVMVASFVKKTMKKAHGVLVDAIAAKASLMSAENANPRDFVSKPLPRRPQSWSNDTDISPRSPTTHGYSHDAASLPPATPPKQYPYGYSQGAAQRVNVGLYDYPSAPRREQAEAYQSSQDPRKIQVAPYAQPYVTELQ